MATAPGGRHMGHRSRIVAVCWSVRASSRRGVRCWCRRRNWE